MKRIKFLTLFLFVSSLLLLTLCDASETKTVKIPSTVLEETIQRTIFVHGDILYRRCRHNKILEQATFDSEGQVTQYCDELKIVNFDEHKNAMSTAKALSLRDTFEYLAMAKNEK